MSSAEWSNQLDLLIRARTPLIWVRSTEEQRVHELLEQTCRQLQRRLCDWNFIAGLSGVLNHEGLGSRQPMAVLQWLEQLGSSTPSLLLVRDFHRFCDDPGIARMLRNLANSLRSTPHTLVLCSGAWTPPTDLEEALTLLDLPLPDGKDLRALIASIASSSGAGLTPDVLDTLVRACSGLSAMRVRQVAARALAKRGQLGADARPLHAAKFLSSARLKPAPKQSGAWMPSKPGWINATARSPMKRGNSAYRCHGVSCWWVRKEPVSP